MKIGNFKVTFNLPDFGIFREKHFNSLAASIDTISARLREMIVIEIPNRQALAKEKRDLVEIWGLILGLEDHLEKREKRAHRYLMWFLYDELQELTLDLNYVRCQADQAHERLNEVAKGFRELAKASRKTR